MSKMSLFHAGPHFLSWQLSPANWQKHLLFPLVFKATDLHCYYLESLRGHNNCVWCRIWNDLGTMGKICLSPFLCLQTDFDTDAEGIVFITVGCQTQDSAKILPLQAAEIYLMEELWRKPHFLFWKVYPSASCLVTLLVCLWLSLSCMLKASGGLWMSIFM